MRRYFGAVSIALLVVSVSGSLRPEGYVALGVGGDLTNGEARRSYFFRDGADVSGYPVSYYGYRASVLSGFWFGKHLGLGLDAEIGPFANGEGTVNYLTASGAESRDYFESQTFWSIHLAPQVRLKRRVLGRRYSFILSVPFGYEYVTGNVSAGSYTYDVSGGALGYGTNLRIESNLVGNRMFGFGSIGYQYSRFHDIYYTTGYDLSLKRKNQYGKIENILNKSHEADMSGIRASLGIGYRWGVN